MNQSKLLLLLETLSNKEIDQLSSLVKAGVFSLSSSSTMLLLEILLQLKTKNVSSKTHLFERVFPRTQYNDQKFRFLQSQMYKVVEKFYLIKDIIQVESNAESDLKLLSLYQKNGLDKHFNASFNKANKKLRANPNYFNLDQQIELQFEYYQFTSLKGRSHEIDFDALLELTDVSYYYKKLRFICYALSHQNIYKSDRTIPFTPILRWVETHDFYDSPFVEVYYYACNMLLEFDNESHFEEFTRIIDQHADSFKADELRSLYFFALNYCIRRLNGGDFNYGRIGIALYERSLETSILFIQGKLSRFSYRNMVMMAIRTGAFEKAEELTRRFEPYLFREDRNAAFHMNLALINYYKGDCDEALSNIVQADFKDHLISLAAKSLQAKIYYDLDEYDLLESHLDSMNMYIIRSKVLGYHKTNYKNIISYFKKLIRLKKFDKNKLEKLRKAIQGEKVLTERKWFLEKLAVY